MQKVFQVFSDPGHGWAKVPFKVLESLGIRDKVTHYSYMRKDYAYLEEDCDLSLFVNAYRLKSGSDPKFKEYSGNKYSKIRGYDHYFYQGV